MQTSNTSFSSADTIKIFLRRVFGVRTNMPENSNLQNDVAESAPADWYEQTHGNTDGILAHQKDAG